MVIRYPNGQPYHKPVRQKIKSKTARMKKVNHSNRGMNLETLINKSIDYYRQQDIAIIHKKPTPVQIVHVDYPKRSAAKITEAYFKRASTTDYNGIYKGHYLDFEAKETRNKTSFPLQNFHEHQIEHMKACEKHGGLVFVIVYFSTLNECYLVESRQLFDAWETYTSGERKSIPYKDIKEQAHLVEIGYMPQVPFIDIIDKLL